MTPPSDHGSPTPSFGTAGNDPQSQSRIKPGSPLDRLRSVADVDAGILFSMANRIWLAGSGFVLIILVGTFTSETIQGFYYTFNSLMYLQVFVEMGLGVALVQLVGHEMAQLRHEAGIVIGDELAKKRLHSLVRFAGIWFTVGCVLLILLLGVLGTAFFFRFGRPQLAAADFSLAMTAWAVFVVGVSLNLIINGILFVVEGSGQVASTARIRLLQGVTGTIGAAAALALGWGLFAIALQTVLMAATGAAALTARHGAMLADLWRFRSDHDGLDWRRDIWPFQSRIAVSWLSGFFTLQFFPPMLFAMAGAKAAGQMGMSLQIFTALNGVAIVVITARTPLFTRLVALGERAELRLRFAQAFKQSMLLLILAVLLLLPVVFIASTLRPDVTDRIVPWPYPLLLATACVGNHVLFAQAAFLRAHRQEPFMALSFASAVVTVICAFSLASLFGLPGAVTAYAAVTLLFTLPIGTRIYLHHWNFNA